jgi:hypothetical protein
MDKDDKKGGLKCSIWQSGPFSGKQKKLWILPLFILLTISFISGCIGLYSDCESGSGNVSSKEFTVDKFHSVDFGVRIKNLEGPGNLYVSMEEVKDLAGSGFVNIIGQSEIITDTLGLSVTGSGSFDLILNAKELNTNIAGSGKANLKGRTTVHNSVISGSGNIKAFNLSTERTHITISGSGNAEVDASKELDVNILGNGNVFYTGDAAVNQSVSGSGKIAKR